ncbi:MAG TPA: DUF2490 domain-containing protein [Vicinamibacterales bacterium]|nr:DUF2490 domain-containing protein [Vicinamibacterales bacterium]
MRRYLCRFVLGAMLVATPSAAAQTTTQLWANVTFSRVQSSTLMYEVDFEPKALVSRPPDEPDWANVDVTPAIEFSMVPWLDLVGELPIGFTTQTDEIDTTEVTVRGGARFHLFSRQNRLLLKEKLPKRRLVIRDLFRAELRHFVYSNDQPAESTGRFRNRVELLFPLNRPNLADAGTIHLLTDWEWFIPLSDQQERFANRQRIRTGVGYRHDAAWRFALLYIWARSRDTTDEPFTTSENIVDFQVKRVW